MRALLSLLFLAGCGFGDAALEDVDPEAAPATPTFSEHIDPLMQIYCTACHAPDAQPGEVDGHNYEGCDAVKSRNNWRGIVQTVFEGNTMPPGGAMRVTEAEILTLKRWAAQGYTCE